MTLQLLYSRGKNHQYPLNRRLDETQGWFGRGGEKKVPSLPLPGIEPPSSSPKSNLYTDWTTSAPMTSYVIYFTNFHNWLHYLFPRNSGLHEFWCKIFTAVKIQVDVIWVVTPCSVMVHYQRFGGPCCLHLQGEVSEDGGSIDLWNVGILPQHYTASQPRKLLLAYELFFDAIKLGYDQELETWSLNSLG
jgi:hypothetical protein